MKRRIGLPQLALVERTQVFGERLEPSLHERGRVLGHGDDIVTPSQVEHAGHHLADRIRPAQRGQHLEVIVHLSGFERVVVHRHPQLLPLPPSTPSLTAPYTDDGVAVVRAPRTVRATSIAPFARNRGNLFESPLDRLLIETGDEVRTPGLGQHLGQAGPDPVEGPRQHVAVSDHVELDDIVDHLGTTMVVVVVGSPSKTSKRTYS